MTKEKSVTAFAPASVGNAGVGFDIMGFALEGVGDTVTVSISEQEETFVYLKGKYGNLIPKERNKNTASVSVDALLNATGNSSKNIEITLEKNLPLGSGMGSSASSAAAAVFAVNELLKLKLAQYDLIKYAMEGERVACGAAHADNVAPSLLGGFCLIRSNEPLDIIQIPVPKDLYCVLVHPHMELLTSVSRSVIKQNVSLADAVKQNANTSAFITSLFKNDFDLMKRSFSDLFAEPYRAPLIHGFDKVTKAALNAGAVGCGISGSGPSVFALTKGKKSAEEVAVKMAYQFKIKKIDSDIFISSVNSPGARII